MIDFFPCASGARRRLLGKLGLVASVAVTAASASAQERTEERRLHLRGSIGAQFGNFSSLDRTILRGSEASARAVYAGQFRGFGSAAELAIGLAMGPLVVGLEWQGDTTPEHAVGASAQLVAPTTAEGQTKRSAIGPMAEYRDPSGWFLGIGAGGTRLFPDSCCIDSAGYGQDTRVTRGRRNQSQPYFSLKGGYERRITRRWSTRLALRASLVAANAVADDPWLGNVSLTAGLVLN